MDNPRLLVFRFSSLGDVAMTVPVIKLLLHQHPQLHIVMVSTEFMRPLFNDIERLHFHAADLKGKHAGITGMLRLFSELRSAYKITAIADLHDVLRTKALKMFFFFSKIPVATIDKGRMEKKELTRQRNKKLRPLKSTFQRYADVFRQLGFKIELHEDKKLKSTIAQKKTYTLGIAPFALHNEKIYPERHMKELLRLISLHPEIKILFFGSKAEADVLKTWEKTFSGSEVVAGKYSFEEELRLISKLDLMLSMDSANMHLASLFSVPVISIWGGTHPYLGFYGWKQPPDYAIQTDLDCRPSSVFGNKRCRNNLECMRRISPLVVYEKIISTLGLQLQVSAAT